MKTISDKICRENENTICSIIFFRKSRHLWYNVEKYCRAGQATDDNMAHVYKLQLRNIWHVFDGEMWRHDSRKFYESVISDAEGRGGHDHLCCIIGRCEIRIFVWLNANLELVIFHPDHHTFATCDNSLFEYDLNETCAVQIMSLNNVIMSTISKIIR